MEVASRCEGTFLWVSLLKSAARKPELRLRRVGNERVLYAIAENNPLDALQVRDMKRAVNALLQLNLTRFRVPQKSLAKYSALDILKQALELLFEFTPSEKNYREAIRTIQVYSEGDEEMQRTIRSSFRLLANAVYNAYSGQRHAESLSPETLFLQGIPIEPNELQQSFRFVGVRPPDVSPPSVKNTVYLDEGFLPYRQMLEGKIDPKDVQNGRQEHWAKIIEANIDKSLGTALIRAGAEHLSPPASTARKVLAAISRSDKGRLQTILWQKGITVKVVQTIADVNKVFGREH